MTSEDKKASNSLHKYTAQCANEKENLHLEREVSTEKMHIKKSSEMRNKVSQADTEFLIQEDPLKRFRARNEESTDHEQTEHKFGKKSVER